MKKFSLLLLPLMLLLLLLNSVTAQTEASLSLTGSAASICTGPAVITIHIDDVPVLQPLQGYDVRVAYDPVSVSATPTLIDGWYPLAGSFAAKPLVCGIDPTLGTPMCTFARSRFGDSTTTGSGDIGYITLTNIGPSPSTLYFAESANLTPLLSDPSGVQIPLADLTSTVYVPGCPTGNDDFGDHPDSYDTLAASGGPFHEVFPDTDSPPDGLPNSSGGVPAIWLGPEIDVEADGNPSAGSDGDDTTALNDADGTIPYQPQFWAAGTNTGHIDISFNSDVNTSNSAWLAVWFDWNNQNGFTEANELAISRAVTWTSTGQIPDTQRFDFNIPAPGVDQSQDLKYRVRLFDLTTEPFNIATAYGDGAANGEIEDHSIPVSDLPVTISYFEAAGDGDDVRFAWQTVSEIGNAGFNLYVETENGRKRINEKIIRSQAIDSVNPQDYEYVANGMEGSIFYIEDVSFEAAARLHGPFKLDEAGGARASMEAIDWEAIRAEHEQKEVQRNAQAVELVNAALAEGDPLQNADKAGFEAAIEVGQAVKKVKGEQRIDLIVDRDGLYRVTYTDLKNAGFKLRRVDPDNLVLLNQDQSVPMRVKSKWTFRRGSFIEFYGVGLDTAYTDKNVYTLLVDPNSDRALRIAEDDSPANGEPEAFYMETILLGDENGYSKSTSNGDPWYDTQFFVYTDQTMTESYSVPVDNYVSGSGTAATLSVGIWGRTVWDVEPDHHVLVELNGAEVKELWFDGKADAAFEQDLLAGILAEGDNALQISYIGVAEVPFGYAFLDSYGVTYPRAFVARDGGLTFEAKGELFEVTGLPSATVEVYRIIDGVSLRLTGVEVAGEKGSYSATFAGSSEMATYVVAADEALAKPAAIKAGRPYTEISSGTADYVIISHEDFIDGLDALEAAREAQGYKVLLVNLADVYAQYGAGIVDPQGIKNYINHAAQNMGAEYFLLVGGDTYDNRGYLANGGISFIPSFYEPMGSNNSLAPVDPKYVDLDDDGVPDRAIGRFPVRSSQELAWLIGKTLAYQSNVEKVDGYGGEAVFAADRGFLIASDNFAGELTGWGIDRVYLDDYSDVQLAKAELMALIEDGAALTSFIGHSAASVWTFSGLLSSSDVQALENPTAPTVVTQWGCSNTYYVDPSYNTMAHQFLVAGENGAAAVMGATGLSYSSSENLLGQSLTPNLVQPGMTVGEAMLAAKVDMASSADPASYVDVLLGWTLLGDPALMVQPQVGPVK